MSDTYSCECCWRTLKKGRPDEEGWAEARAAFAPEELIDAAVVCDDCWQLMRRAMPELDQRYGGTR